MARSRRAWLTPDIDPLEVNVGRCLLVPEVLLPAVVGAMSALTEVWNWEEFGTMTREDAAQAATVMLDAFNGTDCEAAMLLRQNTENPCLLETSVDGETWIPFANLALCTDEVGERLIRENPTTGELEFSLDNGETWTDFPPPDGTPATQPEVPARVPAAGVDDTESRCIAASRAMLQLNEMYRQTYGGIAAGIGNFIGSTTDFMNELSNTLAGIVWGSYYTSAQFVIDAFFGPEEPFQYYTAPELTEAAQDALLSLLYDNVTVVDGFTVFDFGAIRDNVVTELGANPGIAVWSHLNYIQEAGLNRLGDVGFGDLLDCTPEQGLFDEYALGGFGQRGWTPVAREAGCVGVFCECTYDGVNDRFVGCPTCNTGTWYYNNNWVVKTFIPTLVSSVEVGSFIGNAASSSDDCNIQILLNDVVVYSASRNQNNTQATHVFVTNVQCDEIRIGNMNRRPSANGGYGTAWLNSIRLVGDGDNPYA